MLKLNNENRLVKKKLKQKKIYKETWMHGEIQNHSRIKVGENNAGHSSRPVGL
jgi:hypothetical protein